MLVFYDMSLAMSSKMYVKNKAEKHLPYVDAGLAIENMILYAKSMGIDSCIFNLSEYHFKISRTDEKLIKKMAKSFGNIHLIIVKFNFCAMNKEIKNRINTNTKPLITCTAGVPLIKVSSW